MEGLTLEVPKVLAEAAVGQARLVALALTVLVATEVALTYKVLRKAVV